MDLVFVGLLPSLFSFFFCPFHFLVKEELDFPKSEGSLAGSINILSPAEFLNLNPLALIPILVDGDFILAESLAIIMYLDDKYPQYPLLPHDVPKRALNFQDNFIEKKVGPHEKLPWAQSVIRKGFTGDTSLNTIKIYSALEKLLKDHAGRYATGDEIFLCKITWRILIGVAVENVIRQPIPKFKLFGVKIAALLGMNKGMNTNTIVKAKSFLDGDEDQHEKDAFEKNLKALQKIF
ncbi:hypothetical protein Ahy_A09g044357 isoform A [Arachis hypogaea]|uniref:GST N-terminal domain-containing protein n=1 Tax=Arachis hypogaea TaxID=3818 RepID=A0A445BJX8_ARAHY|nr:hypothetical protein Ahy_A09g044357 isoform A [Arachis hypogaea]